MKFAYFVHPHAGGTYTLFAHLRAGLAPHGVDVQWVGMEGGGGAQTDATCGFMVDAGGASGEAERAAALIEALKGARFDGVFVNVLADPLQMNVVRYLPSSMLRVMIVHNITPGTYAAARSLQRSVHATVGVSERCRRDLVERYGFPPRWTAAIPNAVDTAAFSGFVRMPPTDGELRLIFLGRIEDASKGVFWLGGIVDRLPASVHLTVAGDGPDLPRLMALLARHAGRVRFLGKVPQEDVPALLASHDVLVMPSRFEGFGFTIIEAMAAGCVPVVSRISGVTDTIVEDGSSGLLFPVGNWREAVRQIGRLKEEPRLLDRLSRNARRQAAEGFGLEKMAGAYSGLIERLRRERPPVDPPLPLGAWSMPDGMRPGLRTYLPGPVKNWLRVVKERL